MIFVDVIDRFRGELFIILVFNPSQDDSVGERKPDGFVVIFQEFTLHAQDFNIM